MTVNFLYKTNFIVEYICSFLRDKKIHNSNVCVILTKTFENIDSESFSCDKLSIITINKLYVALTRTKGNLYIVKQSDFKKVYKELNYITPIEFINKNLLNYFC